MELYEIVEVRHVQEAVRLMHVATKRAAMDPVTGLIDMDMLTTGRSQATRTMIQRFVTILKDILRANTKEFRG
jgi:DNA replication licensing factor MCM4